MIEYPWVGRGRRGKTPVAMSPYSTGETVLRRQVSSYAATLLRT
jgi:hypothetical protein